MKNIKWTLLTILMIATAAMAADKYISSSGDIVLKTATAKKVNLNDTLYTTQAGKVGIGTSSPTNKMHISLASSGGTASSEAALVIEGTDATRAKLQFLSTDSTGINFGNASSSQLGFINYFTATDEMRIGTASTNRLTIKTDGKVGIGTTGPTYKLDVIDSTAGGTTTVARVGSTSSSGANNGALRITSGGTGTARLLFDYEGGATSQAGIGTASSGRTLNFYVNQNFSTPAMIIDEGAGNVYIGNVLRMGQVVGGNGVGMFHTSGSGPYSCDAQCAANEPSTFDSDSGKCIGAWRGDTGATITCSDATDITHRCLCGGMY